MSDTTEKTPQPVVNTQLIAQGVGIVLALLVTLGLISTGQSEALGDGVSYALVGVPVVAGIIASFKARAKVTPNAAPRDDNGEPLASTDDLRKVAAASFADGKAAGFEQAQPDESLVELARATLAKMPR